MDNGGISITWRLDRDTRMIEQLRSWQQEVMGKEIQIPEGGTAESKAETGESITCKDPLPVAYIPRSERSTTSPPQLRNRHSSYEPEGDTSDSHHNRGHRQSVHSTVLLVSLPSQRPTVYLILIFSFLPLESAPGQGSYIPQRQSPKARKCG